MAEGGSLPLHGIRAVEFGFGIAAPVAARQLAEFGAEVIRVESRRRPDSLRASAAGWVPPEVDPVIRQDTMPSLNFSCPGKRSIGLEVDTPEGYDVLSRLVATSDVFVTNLSADVLPRLRLGYDDIKAMKPDIVYISMTAFGNDGPYRSFRTWGMNLAAIAGVDAMIGWPDRDPVQLPISYADYVTAHVATVALLAALERRDQTGQGCDIQLSQYQMLLACIGPSIMEVALGGTVPGPCGNRLEGRAPHGIYPTRRVDRWVAVSVLDDDMWSAIGTVEGLEQLAGDKRFATVAGRAAQHDELDQRLSEWTKARTEWEAATQLQDAGVAAAPVLDSWDVVGDSQLAARDFFRVLPSARFRGELVFGPAAVLPETPSALDRAAPAFGEDTRYVLGVILGLDDEEINRLVEQGTVHVMEREDVHLERPYLHWIDKLMRLPWPQAAFDPAELFMNRLTDLDGAAGRPSTTAQAGEPPC